MRHLDVLLEPGAHFGVGCGLVSPNRPAAKLLRTLEAEVASLGTSVTAARAAAEEATDAAEQARADAEAAEAAGADAALQHREQLAEATEEATRVRSQLHRVQTGLSKQADALQQQELLAAQARPSAWLLYGFLVRLQTDWVWDSIQ